jgi:hypothetical protein
LHNQIFFEPVRLEDLSQDEIGKAIKSLIFLAEKKDRTVKGRMHANSSAQQYCISKEEALNPAIAKESVLIIGVVEVK